MRTSRTKPSPCPKCGKVLDCSSGIGHKHRPEPGNSVTICIECLALLMYDEQMNLIQAPQEVVDQVSQYPEVRKAMHALLKVKGQHQPQRE